MLIRFHMDIYEPFFNPLKKAAGQRWQILPSVCRDLQCSFSTRLAILTRAVKMFHSSERYVMIEISKQRVREYRECQ